MSDGTNIIFGVAAAAGFLVAASGGFAVGYRFALSAPTRLVSRAGRDTERCLNEAVAAVDVAGRLCEAVAAAALATERQIASLIDRQRQLAEAIGRLRTSHTPVLDCEVPPIQWQLEPLERETELPDRSALEENIARLVAGAKHAPRGGVVLVSLDGLERLRGRIGDAGLSAVRRSVARLLCRAGRDTDLACRLDDGTFAVLMPDADSRDALAQAAGLRDAFRSHPFRMGADGPELLVTASLGFTPAVPADEPRLLLDRAQAAVVRSRRWGRNRLHGYEPQAARFCLISDAYQFCGVAVGTKAS